MKNKIVLFMGITSTMPIVGFSVGKDFISLFDISFVTYLIMTFVYIVRYGKTSFHSTSFRRCYFAFLIWPIISYLVGMIYMPNNWHSSMTNYIIKVFEYVTLTILICIKSHRIEADYFAKGLIVGIIANAVWSILQAVVYYVWGESLNLLIFVNMVGLKSGGEIWNSYGGIRISGFNYDPAHLGGILPILLLYALLMKNKYILVVSLLSLAFSQSTTAVVSCLFVLCVYMYTDVSFQSIWSTKKNRKNFVSLFLGITVITFIVVMFFSSNYIMERFVNGIFENIDGFVKRVREVYLQANDLGARGIYYGKAVDRLFDRGPLLSVTGTGLGTSMFPFRIYSIFSSGAQNTVTEVETNYIAYLFDLGIIGLTIYIVFLFKGLKNFWHMVKEEKTPENVIYLGLFLTVICCSASYHYIFTAYQMVAFSFSTLYMDFLHKNE